MTIASETSTTTPATAAPARAAGWIPLELGYDESPAAADGSGGGAEPKRRIPRRIRKRRLLSLPLAVALLAAGGKLVTMAWFVHQGSAAYESAAFVTSRAEFNRLRFLNVLQPWRAWSDIGDARFRLGDLTGAERAFSEALAQNPSRCDVRFNLAVTIEAQGDVLMGDNVHDVTDSERFDGLGRYRVALDIVNGATCAVGGTESPGFRLADTRGRLEAKLGADPNLQDASQTHDPNDDNVEQSDDAQNNQTLEDQIQQKNQTGEGERQDASDINPTADPEPPHPNW